MVLSNAAKRRRKQTRLERKASGITKCKTCGEYLGRSDKHHIQCNDCWNDTHPFEAMINRRKAGKY